MGFPLVLAVLVFGLGSVSVGAAPRGKAPMQTKLICKTGSEKRPAGQPLRLFFLYNLPLQFEAEDPTNPFGRQAVSLGGRPVVQLQFEKAAVAAGENGEHLQPMQCAWAKRPLGERDPSQVQILLPQGEVQWVSQSLGQRPSPQPERLTLAPTGDWAFAYQFERVFSLEIENTKAFVTTQLPRPL